MKEKTDDEIKLASQELVDIVKPQEVKNYLLKKIAEVKPTMKKPPFQAVEAIGLETGIPSKSRVAISLPETRSQELFTSLKASKPESVSTILNVPPSQFTNRSFIQGYYNTVKKISQETLPAFKSLIEEATGLPADVRIKEFDSFAGKIERYLLDKKSPNEIADNLAGRIIINSENEIDNVINNIQKNIDIKTEIQDFFSSPTDWGYRGINTKVRLPNGLITEIQIHTPQSLKISETIHPIYEKWRNLDLSQLTKEQKSAYLIDRLTTNLFLVTFGTADYNWMGPLFTFFMLYLVNYGMRRYFLMHSKATACVILKE